MRKVKFTIYEYGNLMSKQKNAIPMTIINGILNNSDCVVNAKISRIRKKKVPTYFGLFLLTKGIF